MIRILKATKEKRKRDRGKRVILKVLFKTYHLTKREQRQMLRDLLRYTSDKDLTWALEGSR